MCLFIMCVLFLCQFHTRLLMTLVYKDQGQKLVLTAAGVPRPPALSHCVGLLLGGEGGSV